MTPINTNVKSLVARNAMTANNRALSSAMQQLSTGKRINSARDDAAGLAISTKMTSQIRGLNQAVRNANDAVSMLQTAEGPMHETTNMLQRMRELAVQSANDTNTAEERAYMDLEFQALKDEITRIGSNTQWNGTNILDGNAEDLQFQVGAGAGQIINVSIDNMKIQGSATDRQVTQSNTVTLLGDHNTGWQIIFTAGSQNHTFTFNTDPDGAAGTPAEESVPMPLL